MKKRLKTFGFSLLFLVAVLLLLNYQAKSIVIRLIESNSSDHVKVKIGRVSIHPLNSSIKLKDVSVLVRNSDSISFKRVKIDRMFLDVVSLWDFFSGGTLIIEKFECEGGHLALFSVHERDSTFHSFDLAAIIQRIKSDAIRFRIQDIVFRDFNLSLSKDSTRSPTEINHIHARAQNLYLSADSMVREKPIVEFYLPHQVITLPNELSFGFDSLSFSTTDNSVQVLNLDLKSPPADLDQVYHIHSDKVRLSHFSFETFYKKGELVIDSIFLGKSNISVNWLIDNTKKKNSLQRQGIPAFPRMDIRSISFKEIVSDVVIGNDSIKNRFNVEHASLTIDEFRHRPDSSHVIYAPYYNLLITKYTTLLGGNNTSINFDTVQIQKYSLSLLNFSYHLADQKQPLIQTPRFELQRVDWYEFLVNRRLRADEVRVFDPTIVTSIRQNKDTATPPIDKFRLVQTLNEYLQVSLFSLKNATAFVQVPGSHLELVLRGYNTTFNVMDVVNSRTVNEGMDAIHDFSFKDLRLTHPTYSLHVENFKFEKRELAFGNIDYTAKPNVISLAGLTLRNISWGESNNTLSINGVYWNKLKAEIKESENRQPNAKKSGVGMIPNLYINSIQGGNSNLLFQNKRLRLSTSLDHFNLNEIVFKDSLKLSGLDLKGHSLSLDTRLNDIMIGSYSFLDNGGTLHDIWFNRNTEDYVNVVVDKLSFAAHLPDFVHQKYVVSSLSLDNVQSRFNKRDRDQYLDIDAKSQLTASELVYDNKNFSAGSLLLDVGPFQVIHEKRVKAELPESLTDPNLRVRRLRVGADSLLQNNYSGLGLKQQESRLKFLSSNDSDTSALTKKTIQLKSDRGGIKFEFDGVHSTARDSSMKINAIVNAIQFREVDVKTDKLIAWIMNGSLNNIVLDSDHLNEVWKVLEDNYPTAGINNLKARIETSGNLIRFDRLDYNPHLTSGTVRQFEFRPLQDRQRFLDESYYQTNYMDVKVQSIAFNKLNMKSLVTDTVIQLSSIQVESPHLEIGRDKTHPFFATAVKPLPTNAFKQLKVKFKIDSVRVSDGKIDYTEKSRITELEGTIHFSKMDALVRNVKNIDLQSNDSLHIRANTLFMDSARVNLRVRESYQDTLGSFLLTTQVSPFNTSILNKALVPMVSVDFKSGQVDTLYMRAIGREYLSLGSMKFLYHDLKVEFLDKNDTSRHSIKNQLLKMAANTFVIRTNNKVRTGRIYYERDRNRAVFQYWVKMILSGVTTSVGAKSNKKQIKKYMKNLNQKRIPPIEGDFNL